MLGTVSVTVITATIMDLIMPNIVYSWREKWKARYGKRTRVTYHSRRRNKP
jgi:hypothetical protein